MAVIKNSRRKQPPIWLFLILMFTVFTIVSVGLTIVLALPWILPIPLIWSLMSGIILLTIGFILMIGALRELGIFRALGREINAPREKSQLITTGVYAYTRNPLYLATTLLFMGWLLITRLTVLFILTILFLILFLFAAKWEEQELTKRFGDTYKQYKKTVPFFIPYPKRQKNLEAPITQNER